MVFFVNKYAIACLMDKNSLIRWALAKIIREARSDAGISQAQLAELSGLSYPFISGVERANTGVTITSLIQMAEALQLDITEIAHRLSEELKRGPEPPEKVPGRPRKGRKGNTNLPQTDDDR